MKILSIPLSVLLLTLTTSLVSRELRDWHDYLYSNGCIVTLKDPLPSADRHSQGLNKDGLPLVSQRPVTCLTDSECAETFPGDRDPNP